MEDLKKIRLMTNLAIYDKLSGAQDRKITSYYRRDYVYKKNLTMRIGITVAYLLLMVMFVGHRLFIANADIFELVSKPNLIKMGLPLVVILIIYTIISTIINRARYDLAEERNLLYEKMLATLHNAPPPATQTQAPAKQSFFRGVPALKKAKAPLAAKKSNSNTKKTKGGI